MESSSKMCRNQAGLKQFQENEGGDNDTLA